MTEEERKNICIAHWENVQLVKALMNIVKRISGSNTDDIVKLLQAGHFDKLEKVMKALDIARPNAVNQIQETLEDSIEVNIEPWYVDIMDSAYQLIHDDKEL